MVDERLVVDWSSLDRSKLEAAARRGVVPLHVDGCRARIVDGCTVRRSYTFAATSRQREVIRLADRDELAARLPLLAMRFGANLTQATTLDVTMMVVGRYESSAAPVTMSELDGDCDAATHVVASVSIGAFAIGTGSLTAVDASADVARVGHARERTRLDAAGVEQSCASTRRTDAAPPEDCSVPLRVELRALRTSMNPLARPPSPAPPAVVDGDAMRRAMDAARKELTWCHRVARATSPSLSGVLTLSVKLRRNGNVRSVSAKHEGDLDDALADCAVERVGHVLFPVADDDRPRTVLVPVLFRPGAQR